MYIFLEKINYAMLPVQDKKGNDICGQGLQNMLMERDNNKNM